jgi:alpha-amylase/alpha-mannosidase (GH57 family)
MHQPEYRDLKTGEYKLPWTYLHVIKDYVDMVAHLEAVPQAKAVINFVLILLEQIEEYARQVNCYLYDRIAITDPLLAALVAPSIPADPESRLKLIKDCMRANRVRKLVDMADWIEHHYDSLNYVNSQFIADILVWYHLAWMGETVKLTDNRVKSLIEKGSGYTLHDRIEVLEVLGEWLSSVILRYKLLAGKGQIELSIPFMPILLCRCFWI